MKNLKWIIGLLLSLFLLGIYVKSYAAWQDPLTTIELEYSTV